MRIGTSATDRPIKARSFAPRRNSAMQIVQEDLGGKQLFDISARLPLFLINV